MNVIFLDTNHPHLIESLRGLGMKCTEAYDLTREEVMALIGGYEGIVIRSRFTLDKAFLSAATSLKFIARVGAGVENIDREYASDRGIELIAAPEGNRNAVAEHALGMILALFNKFKKADAEIRQGIWLREDNRGLELDGRTVGLIGYGNMGKAFARKLAGFDVEVLCHDIKKDVGDEFARQVSLEELKEKTEVLSLHTPQTPLTIGMVNASFIQDFKNSFYLINTARGSAVSTRDLVKALEEEKILGACLDVLEYEKSSFEDFFSADKSLPEDFKKLIASEKVLLTPHVAGWTVESKFKLADTIVKKIRAFQANI